jgi:outer membrane protein assembly factor BamB
MQKLCRIPFSARVAAVLSLVAIMLPGSGTAAGSENWPRWRGPHDNGSLADGSYPVKWETNSLLWKTRLPGKGCSTPIVWDKRIYLTAPTNGIDAALAFDWSGKLLWLTRFDKEQPGRHRNGSGSNPSPATDGQTLAVYFKSGTLAALDPDGKVRWQTNLVTAFGPENLFWDQGTSPVLTAGDVVFARMHHGESWVAAFDKKTGALRWKAARNYETPVEGDNAYTTPLVIQHDGKEALLIWGGQHVTAHDASNGGLLWWCGDFNPRQTGYWPQVASPVIGQGVVVVASGRADKGQPRFYGVKLGGKGDVTKTHKVWTREDTGTFVPTPAEYRGLIYILRDRGEIECLDPVTGKRVWSAALPKSSSNYYSSPVVAGGNLYAIREDGAVFVAKVQGGFELLHETAMGERVIASPVAAANRLLIRGDNHLFCVGEK